MYSFGVFMEYVRMSATKFDRNNTNCKLNKTFSTKSASKKIVKNVSFVVVVVNFTLINLSFILKE